MQANDELEDFFRKRLQDDVQDPPPMAWNRIQQQVALPKSVPVKTLLMPQAIWKAVLGIGGGLAIAVSAYVWQGQQETISKVSEEPSANIIDNSTNTKKDTLTLATTYEEKLSATKARSIMHEESESKSDSEAYPEVLAVITEDKSASDNTATISAVHQQAEPF